jgi:hypothetical protein
MCIITGTFISSWRIELTGAVHSNVDIVSERLTQIRVAFCDFSKFRAIEGPVEWTVRSSTAAALPAAPGSTPRAHSELKQGECLRRRFHLIRPRLTLRLIEHVLRTAMRVNRNVLPDGSAEQPVNRITSDLSGEIPECDVDATDGRDVRRERILCGGHHVKVPLDR